MGVLIFVGTLALAVVFLVSGAAKLASPTGAARLLQTLTARLNQRAAIVAVRIVAVAELATVSLLMFSATRTPGYLFSLALGAGILTVSIYSVISGYRMPCGCFGTARSAPPIGSVHASTGAAIVAISTIALSARVTALDISAIYLSTVSLAALTATFVRFSRVIAEPWLYLLRGDTNVRYE